MPDDSMSGILRSDGQKIDNDRRETKRGSIFQDLGGKDDVDAGEDDGKFIPQNFKDFFVEVFDGTDSRINMNKVNNRSEANDFMKEELARMGKSAKLGNRYFLSVFIKKGMRETRSVKPKAKPRGLANSISLKRKKILYLMGLMGMMPHNILGIFL
jgi:hypothetical protein